MEPVFLIIWAVLAIGVGMLAMSRGRSGFGYFLLAAFLSPLIGLIVVMVMRDEHAAQEADRRRKRDEELRLEEIKALTAASRPAPAAPAAALQPKVMVAPMFSVADEIIKLAALRDKGLLTDDEFQAQRMALLKH